MLAAIKNYSSASESFQCSIVGVERTYAITRRSEARASDSILSFAWLFSFCWCCRHAVHIYISARSESENLNEDNDKRQNQRISVLSFDDRRQRRRISQYNREKVIRKLMRKFNNENWIHSGSSSDIEEGKKNVLKHLLINLIFFSVSIGSEFFVCVFLHSLFHVDFLVQHFNIDSWDRRQWQQQHCKQQSPVLVPPLSSQRSDEGRNEMKKKFPLKRQQKKSPLI